MAENRLFLGVEHSATGRAWRDRLDERGAARALAIAQRHELPELLARILAGRNVEVDAVDAFLDPTIKRSMPDPNVLTAMPEAADAHRRRGHARREHRDLRRLRRRRRDLRRAAGALPAAMAASSRSSTFPTGCSKATARTSRRCARSPRAARRCWSPSIAAPPASSRLAKRKALGIDVVVIDHHQADEALPPAVGHRQSEPARRSLRARPSRRRRPRVHDRGGGQSRAARRAASGPRRGPSPIC